MLRYLYPLFDCKAAKCQYYQLLMLCLQLAGTMRSCESLVVELGEQSLRLLEEGVSGAKMLFL